MATYKVIEPYLPFDYGSQVLWLNIDGAIFEGSICGFRVIEDEQTATELGVTLGTVFGLVEFSNGDSAEIPLSGLKLL
jgi:hypothetical protein